LRQGQGRFFHGYYDNYYYLPLYVFCGRGLLLAKLRRSEHSRQRGRRRGDRPDCGADPPKVAARADDAARRLRLCARSVDALVRDKWR